MVEGRPQRSVCDQWDKGHSEDSAGVSDTEVVKCSPEENHIPRASDVLKFLLNKRESSLTKSRA